MKIIQKITSACSREAQAWKEVFEQMKQRSYEDLHIDSVWIAKHKDCPLGVLGIDWHGSPGFGTYQLHIGEDGKLHGYSEYMDKQDDKQFIMALLTKLVEEMEIEW